MKKLFAFLLSAILLTMSVSAVDLYVDSEALETDTPPTIVEGRTLVPVRAIFESLGASVEWEPATKTATGTKGGTTIVIQIDNTTAYVNGEARELDVPAQLINDRTMVPARFISEAFDAAVYWVQETQTVRIAAQVYDVIRVVDGDTIVVDYNGYEEKVRLIGVDTPESVHPVGSKNTQQGISAADYTKEHLEGKQVELEFDVQERDQYGRLLAYVYVDGVMYNKTLLEDGIANLATYPPNVKYVDEFTAIAQSRESDGAGGTDDAFKTAGTYVGSITSDKYHYPDCRFAQKILPENELWFDTAEQAHIAGYTSCGVCKP